MIKVKGLLFESVSELMEELFENARVELSLTRDQFEEILKSEKGKEIYKSFDETLTDFFLERFNAENFKKEQSISYGNAIKITESNQNLFQFYFAFVHSAHIVYRNILDHLEKQYRASDLEIRDLVNITLYGNLCRLSDQIGTLLTSGYPDGALILWRTFYEYAVVAVFLMTHNSNQLSERFKDASQRDLKRQVDSHNKRHADLKFPPLDDRLVKKVEDDFQEIKSKYSKEFFDNDYSWAQGYIKGKPNFLNLEEDAGFGRYRPFYIWASGKAHPNYKELTAFRDSTQAFVLRYVTIQEIDKISMVDPAQLTLSVFDQVNSHFLNHYSVHYEYDTNMLMFRKIYEQFSNAIS